MKRGARSALVWAGALFGAFCLLFLVGLEAPATTTTSATTPAAACLVRASVPEVRWRRLLDGDTLVLEDGRRVRVIGVNAPEVSSKETGEPFADEATLVARQFLSASPVVLLQVGVEARDRYGRLLAHVFRATDGASLAAELIAQGLAWQIAVPPNLAYLDCNRAAEREARVGARGVWSSAYLKTDYAARLQPGFRVLTARIEQVVFKKTWWLETDGGFVVSIQPSDQSLFERSAVAKWQGARVEVRGWMVSRAGSDAVKRGHRPWVIPLRHPSTLRLLQ